MKATKEASVIQIFAKQAIQEKTENYALQICILSSKISEMKSNSFNTNTSGILCILTTEVFFL